jgi:hypothetical protein
VLGGGVMKPQIGVLKAIGILQGLIRHFRPEMEDRIGRAADQIAEQERRRIAA